MPATRKNDTISCNASASEELASTAEEMAAQAEALQELVSFFRVAGVEQLAKRRPARAAAPAPASHPVSTLVPSDGHGYPRANGASSDFKRF